MARLDDLLGEIKALAQEAMSQTELDAAQVSQQINFVRGFQWDLSNAPPWFQSSEQHPDAERSRLNLVRRLISAYSSMVVGSVPGLEVSPRTGTSLAELQAESTERIISGMWREDAYFPMSARANAVFLAAVNGASWIKVCYNPTKVRERGGRVEGDIDVQVFSRNEVHPDPAARREEDISYIFETESIPVSLALTRYPKDVYGRPTDGSTFERQTADDVHLSDWSLEGEDRFRWGGVGSHESRNYRVKIIKCWWRPGRHFPNGLFMAYSGERVLSLGPLPYDWPWVMVPGPYPVPWRLYPDGMLMDLEAPQRDANEISGRIIEWIKRCSAPTILAHEESKVDEDEFTDMAGGIIRWSGNRPPPSWMSPPAPPGQLFGVVDQRLDLMKVISAISEINLGSVPTDDFSGRAVAILEDLQRSSHGEAFSTFHRVCLLVIRKMLRLAQEFWPEGKTLIATGDMGKTDVAVFRRAEFDPEALIAVSPGNGPKSRMAARAEVLELFTAGVFMDDPAAARARSELRLASEGETTDVLHRRKALRENVALFEGGHTPEVDMLDDHEVHFRVHERALFSETDPQLRRILAEHMIQHTQAMLPMIATEAPGPASPAPGGGAAAPGGGAESPMNGGVGDLESMGATGKRPGPA